MHDICLFPLLFSFDSSGRTIVDLWRPSFSKRLVIMYLDERCRLVIPPKCRATPPEHGKNQLECSGYESVVLSLK